MCGLAGLIGHKLGYGELQRFHDIFTFSQVRGAEGSGIAVVPDRKEDITAQMVRVRRSTWSSGHLVTLQDYADAFKGDVNIVMGHARQPTKGDSKLDNVHPHRCGDIILVHNGTMTWIDNASVPHGQSDSKIICKTIANKGIQSFIDDSSGAFALVWLDLKAQTINFLRNNQRPLWLCNEHFSSVKGSPVTNVWWASEFWMLNIGLSRYTGYMKERFNYFALPENELHTYSLDTKKHIEPVVTKMVRKPFISAQSGVYSSRWEDDYGSWANDLWGDDTIKDSTTTSTRPTPSNGDQFVYVPPECRPKSTSTPVVVAGRIFSQSRSDAKLNTASVIRIGGGGASALFPPSPRDLDYYKCKDNARVRSLIDAAPCVWCSSRPTPLSENGQTVMPRIFPVRYTDSRGEYVCDACISDLDVQRMVGIAV